MVWLIIISVAVVIALWAQHDNRQITADIERQREQDNPYRLYQDMLDIDNLIQSKPK